MVTTTSGGYRGLQFEIENEADHSRARAVIRPTISTGFGCGFDFISGLHFRRDMRLTGLGGLVRVGGLSLS
ncbi:hypothetical protein ZHAS_00021347 [Anopheles sinensis]|uniref:Uncharacterized protein n=1 Tax=Anopheles sinensis TaxID=74873 RepID=A0A084WS52_ANOSI|nr:hypothetical protein ZHAS_00021347 [Anopheles sinensis]